MPSKLFGQYQQEQVQQINYLPYTAKMAEMLASTGEKLGADIGEAIKGYRANNDLAEFNKIQTSNIAPILASMRGEMAKSKELSAYLPEVDAQIQALAESNSKAPKVAAGIIQSAGAYINGFNERFKTQQNLQNVNVAGDITNNFVTSVSGSRPATLDSSSVDYNGDLTHWQNLSNWNDYLDKAEAEGKTKGVTVDRKAATVGWLKSKLEFIQNNEIENLTPEKRDKLIEVLSSEIESMNLGTFADGTPYDPSKTVDSTFTINDVNGNPVTVKVPAKETPAPAVSPADTRATNATPVATGAIIPTGIPTSPITPASVGAPAPVPVGSTAPAKVVSAPAKVIPAPAKVTTVPLSPSETPAWNPRNILQPVETASSTEQTQETDDNLLFEELADPATGKPIPSSHWEEPVKDIIEVAPDGQLTPEQLKKYKNDNSDIIDKEGKIKQEVLDDAIESSRMGIDGNFKVRVNRKPDDQDIINKKKEELSQGYASRFLKPVKNEAPTPPAKVEGKPVSTLAPEKVDVNPMRSSKMAMALPMGITPQKVAPIKTTTPTGRPRTPEQIEADKVKSANEGVIKDKENVLGKAIVAEQWANKFLKDIAENPDNPKSIDFGMYGGWAMKNPNKADVLGTFGTVATFFAPVGGGIKGVQMASKVSGSKLMPFLQRYANKVIEAGIKAGKPITEEQAFAQAVKTANDVRLKATAISAGGGAVALTAAESGFLDYFASNVGDWAMPNLDKVYNKAGQEELKDLSENLIDEIRTIRGGGFQFGTDDWEDLTNGQRQAKLFKIEDAINKYKEKVKAIQDNQKAEIRQNRLKPLTRGDIVNGASLSSQVSTTNAVLEKIQPNKGIVIHGNKKADIIAGTQEYVDQLSLDEQKDRMKKFMVQKYGYIPSGFEQMFRTLHPETDFQTMAVGNTMFYRDATKGWTPLQQKEVQPKSLKQQAEDSAFLFGTPNEKGDFVPREFIEGSGVYLRGLFRGTEKQLNEFYEKYDGLIKARKIVKRLQVINNMFGESMPWNQEVQGEVKGLISDLKSSYRTEIIGVGTVSNYEQELIADVIADPTTFWSWEAKDRAKLLTILNRTNDRIKSMPTIHGLEVRQIEEKGEDTEKLLRANLNLATGKSDRQLKWEKKHPELANLDNSGKKRQIVIPE